MSNASNNGSSSDKDRLEISQGSIEITIDGEVVKRIEMDGSPQEHLAFAETILELMEKISIDNMDDPINGYFAKAVLFIQLQRWQEALECGEQAINLAPERPETYATKALVLQALGRLEEALECVEKGIQLDASNSMVHNVRASVLTILQRPQEALEEAAQAQRLAAPEHYKQGHEEALSACEQAVLFDPTHGQAQCNRGAALIFLKRFEEAVVACNLAIYLKSDESESHIVSAYRNKGLALLQLGRDEEALAAFEQAIQLSPNEGEYYYKKGSPSMVSSVTRRRRRHMARPGG